jgi:hypothetical protein
MSTDDLRHVSLSRFFFSVEKIYWWATAFTVFEKTSQNTARDFSNKFLNLSKIDTNLQILIFFVNSSNSVR